MTDATDALDLGVFDPTGTLWSVYINGVRRYFPASAINRALNDPAARDEMIRRLRHVRMHTMHSEPQASPNHGP